MTTTGQDLQRGETSRSLRQLLGGMLAFGVFATMVACFGRSHPGKPLVPELDKPRPTVAATAATPGVELIAEASGNIVMVTVINHTAKEIVIGPKMFGAIADGQIHPVDPRDVTIQFPIKAIRREEGVSGAFQFRGLKSLEGEKLILNSPEVGKMFVIIRRYEPQQADYQITTRLLNPAESRRLQRQQEKLREALLKELLKRQAQQPTP